MGQTIQMWSVPGRRIRHAASRFNVRQNSDWLSNVRSYKSDDKLRDSLLNGSGNQLLSFLQADNSSKERDAFSNEKSNDLLPNKQSNNLVNEWHDSFLQGDSNEWLPYVESHSTINELPDISLNHSGLELSIDGSNEQENLNQGNMSTSTSKTLNMDMNDVVDLYRIVVPVLLAACCLSFIFNLTMVCSVRCVRRKLSPTICLSLSLAMADAYASLVIGLGLLVNSLLPIVFQFKLGPLSFCFILSLEAFRLGGLVVTVLHLLALAVNHYIGILRPLHYAHIVTRETIIVGIVAMWIFPVVFFLVYFASIPNDGFQSESCTSYEFLLYSPFRVTTSVMFFFPLILMTLMYSHMFVVVRQHQRGLLHCPSNRSLHKNVKAIITTLLILGTYILGWIPAVLFFVLTCLDCAVPFTEIPLRVRVPVGIFINAMIVAKSFMDPVIYVVRMPEIKFALKSIWITRCGHLGVYATPSHSRTDIKRLTLLTSRRRSNLNGRNGSPNDKNCSPNDKNGVPCSKNGVPNGTIVP